MMKINRRVLVVGLFGVSLLALGYGVFFRDDGTYEKTEIQLRRIGCGEDPSLEEQKERIEIHRAADAGNAGIAKSLKLEDSQVPLPFYDGPMVVVDGSLVPMGYTPLTIIVASDMIMMNELRRAASLNSGIRFTIYDKDQRIVDCTKILAVNSQAQEGEKSSATSKEIAKVTMLVKKADAERISIATSPPKKFSVALLGCPECCEFDQKKDILPKLRELTRD